MVRADINIFYGIHCHRLVLAGALHGTTAYLVRYPIVRRTLSKLEASLNMFEAAYQGDFQGQLPRQVTGAHRDRLQGLTTGRWQMGYGKEG